MFLVAECRQCGSALRVRSRPGQSEFLLDDVIIVVDPCEVCTSQPPQKNREEQNK